MNFEQSPENYLEHTQASWDEKIKAGWGKEKPPTPFLMDFIEKHRQEIGPMVLDLGCGPGRNVIGLAKEGFKVTGLDLSRTALEETDGRLKENQLEADLVEGASNHLPFNDKSFDFVVSIGSIHHNRWSEIVKSFNEVNRVLTSRGYFLFQGRSVNDNSAARRALEDFGCTTVDLSGSKAGVVQHYFSKEELLKLAEENDFEVIFEPKEIIKPLEADPNLQRARWWAVFRKTD
jgi:ubiquinone/menaquinone biosynthesis C-methylase UbiE